MVKIPKREDFLFMNLDFQDDEGNSLLKVRASSRYEKNLRWLQILLEKSTIESLDAKKIVFGFIPEFLNREIFSLEEKHKD